MVKYVANEVIQFYEARHDFALVDYPGGYPQPTDSVGNLHWKPVNPVYQALRSLTYATLVESLDGSVDPGQLYEITNRPNAGAVVYACFDTDSPQFAEYARVQGRPGLWRYDVVADSLTAVGATRSRA